MIDADSRGRGMPRPYNTAEFANFYELTAFYSPPYGDGGMWWSVTPSSSLLTEFRH